MSLEKFFNPASIAIIGASRDPKKIGNITLRNLLDSGYSGEIFPINPQIDNILEKKSYPEINKLPIVPELCIISIPVNITLQALESAAKFGIKNFVVFTAGFKEIGYDGLKLENELIEISKKYSLNILGPNCFGFVNSKAKIGDKETKINATFGIGVKNYGELKFISQSGAIAASIFDFANYNGLGFSDFITLGNKSIITENEVLEYLKPQENSPLGLYLESLDIGEKFLEKVKDFSIKSPVFILKPGVSRASKMAMQSHTGSMAGEDIVLQEALINAGVIRCTTLEDLFDLSTTLSWIPVVKGSNIAVISNAGGPAVITADHVSAENFNLIPLDDNTKSYLSSKLPRSASLLNPIDLLGDALADRYKEAVEAVCKMGDSVSAIIVILTPQALTEIEKTAEVISELAKKYNKPLVCSFIGGSRVEKGEVILNKYKIPSFNFPQRAVWALARYRDWYNWQQNQVNHKILVPNTNISNLDPQIDQILQSAKKEDRKVLNGWEVSEILHLAGLETAKSAIVRTIYEASNYVKDNGFPVVMKVFGNDEKFLHKKELHGVVTNITSQVMLEDAFNSLSKISQSREVIIQKHIDHGVEVIVGIKKDVSFGYFMNFGAGGTYTEILKDINIGILNSNLFNAESLVKKSKIYKILQGFRGEDSYNIDRITIVLDNIADIVRMYPVFEEFEINPLIITRDKIYAVDGKAILK